MFFFSCCFAICLLDLLFWIGLFLCCCCSCCYCFALWVRVVYLHLNCCFVVIVIFVDIDSWFFFVISRKFAVPQLLFVLIWEIRNQASVWLTISVYMYVCMCMSVCLLVNNLLTLLTVQKLVLAGVICWNAKACKLCEFQRIPPLNSNILLVTYIIMLSFPKSVMML